MKKLKQRIEKKLQILKIPQFNLSDYQIKGKLGEGSYGSIYKVITSNEQPATEEKKPEEAKPQEVKPEPTEVKNEQSEVKLEVSSKEEKPSEQGPKKLENTQENKDLSK